MIRPPRALAAAIVAASVPLSGAACNAILENQNGVLVRRDAGALDGTLFGDDARGGDGGDDDGGGCGADLTRDALNCGRCRHDCLGGACAAGRCGAVEIVAGDASATRGSLALDDAFVYWVDIDGVYRASLEGGGAMRLRGATAGNTSTRSAIVAAQGHLAWVEFVANEYVVRACATNDCGDGAQTKVLVHGAPYPNVFGATSDGVFLRWPSSTDGIWLAPWDGTGPKLVQSDLFTTGPSGFANESGIGWGFGQVDASTLRFLRLPLAGGAPWSLSVSDPPTAVALSGDGGLFWTTVTQVVTAALDAGAPRSIAPVTRGVAVRVARDRVYFVDIGSHRLASCPTVGACAPAELLAAGDVDALEANDAFVVWRTAADGSILRVVP